MPNSIKQTDLLLQGAHYPSGFYVGELCHPRNGKRFPAVIPSEIGSLLIHYKQQNIQNVAQICEDLIAHLILGLSQFQLPKINIIDKSLYNVFPNIMRINIHHNVNLLAKDNEIDEFVQKTFDLIRERSYNIIDNEIKSVYQYNGIVDERAQDVYLFNIINLNHYATSIERINSLINMLNSANNAGIKFLFYFDKELFAQFVNGIEIDKNKLHLSKLIQNLIENTEQITLDNKDIFLGSSDYFKPLDTIIRNNKMTAEVSMRSSQINIFENTLSNFKDIYQQRQSFKPSPFLTIEVGVTPNGKNKCYFELGDKNQAFHSFMIGMNGTGKTTLLDHIIKGISTQFTPEQAELYLFDYKEGVEFKKYAELPHSKVVMLDKSRIDLIIKTLRDFHKKIEERGHLFKKHNVKNINEFNCLTDCLMSRCFLIVDEVQELFKGSQANEIDKLLIDIARRGRAFGLHMIMSTQTLAGYSINTELLSQFKMRVSFSVDVFDAMKIFMVGNEAPVYLKPFEFILNDEMGVSQGNKKILMNKPISDNLIKDLALQYQDRNYQCLVIEETENDKENNFVLDEGINKIQDNNPFTIQTVFPSSDKTLSFMEELEQAENLPSSNEDWDNYWRS